LKPTHRATQLARPIGRLVISLHGLQPALLARVSLALSDSPLTILQVAASNAQESCEVTFQFPIGTYDAHSFVLLVHLRDFPFTLRCGDSTNVSASTPPRVPSATRNRLLASVQQINDARMIYYAKWSNIRTLVSFPPRTARLTACPLWLFPLAQRYGHRRLIVHCSARIVPQIVSENVMDF
jgi:hypothetical protein